MFSNRLLKAPIYLIFLVVGILMVSGCVQHSEQEAPLDHSSTMV